MTAEANLARAWFIGEISVHLKPSLSIFSFYYEKKLYIIILKLEYFCFVHFFVHRTVSRFEAEIV